MVQYSKPFNRHRPSELETQFNPVFNAGENQMKLIKDLGMQYPNINSNRKSRYGLYECPKCLKEFKTRTDSVNRMASTMCMSCANIIRFKTHGESTIGSKLYGVWGGIKNRCYQNKSDNYHRYGGRGITLCVEWRKSYSSFKKWALVNGYKEGLEIDRLDNDGNYEPSNCRWITHRENIIRARSRGGHSPIIKISLDESSELCEAYATGLFSYKEIAEKYNVTRQAIYYILKQSGVQKCYLKDK